MVSSRDNRQSEFARNRAEKARELVARFGVTDTVSRAALSRHFYGDLQQRIIEWAQKTVLELHPTLNPQDVFDEFGEFVLTFDVLSRTDLARALELRVNQFDGSNETNAQILWLIKELADHPEEQNVPKFKTIVADSGKPTKWRDIFGEEPGDELLEGSEAADPKGLDSEDSDFEIELSNDPLWIQYQPGKQPSTPVRKRPGSELDGAAVSPAFGAQRDDEDGEAKKAKTTKEQGYWKLHDGSMSEADLIREALRCVQGYATTVFSSDSLGTMRPNVPNWRLTQVSSSVIEGVLKSLAQNLTSVSRVRKAVDGHARGSSRFDRTVTFFASQVLSEITQKAVQMEMELYANYGEVSILVLSRNIAELVSPCASLWLALTAETLSMALDRLFETIPSANGTDSDTARRMFFVVLLSYLAQAGMDEKDTLFLPAQDAEHAWDEAFVFNVEHCPHVLKPHLEQIADTVNVSGLLARDLTVPSPGIGENALTAGLAAKLDAIDHCYFEDGLETVLREHFGALRTSVNRELVLQVFGEQGRLRETLQAFTDHYLLLDVIALEQFWTAKVLHRITSGQPLSVLALNADLDEVYGRRPFSIANVYEGEHGIVLFTLSIDRSKLLDSIVTPGDVAIYESILNLLLYAYCCDKMLSVPRKTVADYGSGGTLLFRCKTFNDLLMGYMHRVLVSLTRELFNSVDAAATASPSFADLIDVHRRFVLAASDACFLGSQASTSALHQLLAFRQRVFDSGTIDEFDNRLSAFRSSLDPPANSHIRHFAQLLDAMFYDITT